MTIGVDFGSRIIDLNEEKVKLQIWDTAGQESFRSIARSYYRDASGALLVFDVTRRETFGHLSRWLEEARQFASPNICITLVGNKADVVSKRVIPRAEAQAFADENGLEYIEASAKSAEGVDDAFVHTAERIWEKMKSGGMGMRKSTGAEGDVSFHNHQLIDSLFENSRFLFYAEGYSESWRGRQDSLRTQEML